MQVQFLCLRPAVHLELVTKILFYNFWEIMKTIVPASINNLDFIAKGLVQRYQETNSESGYPIYKTDYDLFYRVTESRIRTKDSGFSYYVLKDWDVLEWFLILLAQGAKGEVLMIYTKNMEDIAMMLNFAISELKNIWCSQIAFELSPSQVEYKKQLDVLWAKLFSTKFVL